MSKEPAIPPQADGEPSSRGSGANDNAAPSQPPGTRRSRHASERQAVHGALHDGAGTSAAMAAHGGHERRVTLQVPSQEEGQVLQHPGQRQHRSGSYGGYRREASPHGGDSGLAAPPYGGGASGPGGRAPRGRVGIPTAKTIERVSTLEFPPVAGRSSPPLQGRRPSPPQGRSRPSYVPPSQRRREQPHYAEQPPVHGPYPLGGVQEERPTAPLQRYPLGGLSVPGGDAPHPRWNPFKTKKKETRPTFWGPVSPHDAHPRTPGEAAPHGGDSSHAAPPGGDSLAAPAYGGSAAVPAGGAPGGRVGIPTAKTIERVTTLEFMPPVSGRPPPPPQGHDSHPHFRPQMEEQYPRMTDPSTEPSPGKKGRRTERQRESPFLLPERKKKRRPLAFCFTLCCILFWLLVVGLGIAVLLVYLVYHPQPPRLRVTTATLNAGYVDQLPPPRGGLALNSDLYILATISNPNTKVSVVMRYMQLDLFFRGVMIGTQAVMPIHEEPGESALRSVQIVVSEVRLSQEDAEAWHNATTSRDAREDQLVELQIKARFHVQLNFGHWLPFRYWVYPSCKLWLDPPPGGALRRARCRK